MHWPSGRIAQVQIPLLHHTSCCRRRRKTNKCRKYQLGKYMKYLFWAVIVSILNSMMLSSCICNTFLP